MKVFLALSLISAMLGLGLRSSIPAAVCQFFSALCFAVAAVGFLRRRRNQTPAQSTFSASFRSELPAAPSTPRAPGHPSPGGFSTDF